MNSVNKLILRLTYKSIDNSIQCMPSSDMNVMMNINVVMRYNLIEKIIKYFKDKGPC